MAIPNLTALLLLALLALFSIIVSAEVAEITSANFDQKVGKGVWFVKFYAPWCGHCKNLAPVWEDLEVKLATTTTATSRVRVGRVNCDVETELSSRFKVQGYPTLLLLNDGQVISEYSGAPRTLDNFLSFVRRMTSESKSDGKVQLLTDKNFDFETASPKNVWFVKFFAPWCSHCKSLAPVWEKLAQGLKGTNVFVAKIDCTSATEPCERLKVQGYPTLKVIVGNKVYDYDNTRNLEKMKEFAMGGYKSEASIEKPPAGSPSFLSIIMSNPLYIFGFALALCALMIVCVLLLVCFCTDDDFDTTSTTASKTNKKEVGFTIPALFGDEKQEKEE